MQARCARCRYLRWPAGCLPSWAAALSTELIITTLAPAPRCTSSCPVLSLVLVSCVALPFFSFFSFFETFQSGAGWSDLETITRFIHS